MACRAFLTRLTVGPCILSLRNEKVKASLASTHFVADVHACGLYPPTTSFFGPFTFATITLGPLLLHFAWNASPLNPSRVPRYSSTKSYGFRDGSQSTGSWAACWWSLRSMNMAIQADSLDE